RGRAGAPAPPDGSAERPPAPPPQRQAPTDRPAPSRPRAKRATSLGCVLAVIYASEQPNPIGQGLNRHLYDAAIPPHFEPQVRAVGARPPSHRRRSAVSSPARIH